MGLTGEMVEESRDEKKADANAIHDIEEDDKLQTQSARWRQTLGSGRYTPNALSAPTVLVEEERLKVVNLCDMPERHDTRSSQTTDNTADCQDDFCGKGKTHQAITCSLQSLRPTAEVDLCSPRSMRSAAKGDDVGKMVVGGMAVVHGKLKRHETNRASQADSCSPIPLRSAAGGSGEGRKKCAHTEKAVQESGTVEVGHGLLVSQAPGSSSSPIAVPSAKAAGIGGTDRGNLGTGQSQCFQGAVEVGHALPELQALPGSASPIAAPHAKEEDKHEDRAGSTCGLGREANQEVVVFEKEVRKIVAGMVNAVTQLNAGTANDEVPGNEAHAEPRRNRKPTGRRDIS